MAQIKKDTSLRKAILQAAITEQLSSNVEGITETGKELLDKIIEERNKKLLAEWEEALKKNVGGKATLPSFASKTRAKKPSPIVASEIDEEEIPFDIPENWCWCRLSDYLDIRDGTHDSPKFYNEGIPFVTSKNLNNGKLDFSDCKYITEEDHKKFSARSFVEDGDILFAMIGSIGNPVMVKKEFDFSFKNMALFKRYSKENTDMKYIYHYLCHIQNELKEIATGGVQSFIGLSTFRELIFPLPPLKVQKAIVAKLEQVLPLVDAYENAILQKEELKSALPDKVKKAILQEAITGQLTEAWRKSATIKESGKQLLDRIIEERNAKALAEWEETNKKNPKAKKPVPVVASEIEEDEIPFEVPESWCWCRWGELSYSIQYGYNAPAKETGRIKMVRITDIQNGKVQWDTVPYCDISDEEIITYKLKKNDILFARTGGTVGKSFLVDEEPENAVYAGYLIRTQYDAKKLNPKYMKMFMESQLYWEQLKNGTIATAQPNCNGQTLSKMILPLPPMEEQDEIVKKVEELLPLCK